MFEQLTETQLDVLGVILETGLDAYLCEPGDAEVPEHLIAQDHAEVKSTVDEILKGVGDELRRRRAGVYDESTNPSNGWRV